MLEWLSGVFCVGFFSPQFLHGWDGLVAAAQLLTSHEAHCAVMFLAQPMLPEGLLFLQFGDKLAYYTHQLG